MSKLMTKSADKICRLLIGRKNGIRIHPPAVLSTATLGSHVLPYGYFTESVLPGRKLIAVFINVFLLNLQKLSSFLDLILYELLMLLCIPLITRGFY